MALKQALRIMDIFSLHKPVVLRASPKPERFFQSLQKLIMMTHLSPLARTFGYGGGPGGGGDAREQIRQADFLVKNQSSL